MKPYVQRGGKIDGNKFLKSLEKKSQTLCGRETFYPILIKSQKLIIFL
jgi:hypothetical protein